MTKVKTFRPGKPRSLLWVTQVIALAMCIVITGCGDFFVSGDTLVGITVSPTNSAVKLSSTQQFMAIGKFGDDTSKDISSSVNWSSSSGKVALINSSGIATGYSTGNTTITASQGSISGSTNLTVTINGSGLTVSPSSQTVAIGQTVQFTVTLNGSSVSGAGWSSSRSNVATIDQNGVATALTSGATTITATATISGTQYQGTATLNVQ